MMNETAAFFRMMDRITEAVRHLPVRAATVAVNFSKERFILQNWVEGSKRQPWKARSNNTWGKRTRKGRAILVDSGRLRRSIRTVYVDENMAIIGTDVPYARAHNEGFKGQVIQQVKAYTRGRYSTEKKGTGVYSIKTRREHTKTVRSRSGSVTVSAHRRVINQNIPQRQFIGPSAVLDRRLERMITSEIVKTFK